MNYYIQHGKTEGRLLTGRVKNSCPIGSVCETERAAQHEALVNIAIPSPFDVSDMARIAHRQMHVDFNKFHEVSPRFLARNKDSKGRKVVPLTLLLEGT